MVRSPLQKRIASALLLTTVAVQLHVSGAWAALQNVPAFTPIISVGSAEAQAATFTLSTKEDIRAYVNAHDNANVNTNFIGQGFVKLTAPTAQRICAVAGYSRVASTSCNQYNDARCNFTSCGDNYLSAWNGSSWVSGGACGAQWLSQITCDTPVNTGGGAQCQDGIDNDGDGKIDALVTGTTGGGVGGSGGNFAQEGADPKYGKTWIASITCRNGNGAATTIGGGGDPEAVKQAVANAIVSQGMGLAVPTAPLVRSDNGSNWDAPGTFHTPTLNAVCQILGYDTYVSSTCRDGERSGLYPTGKCNYHTPGDNYMFRFNGTLSIPACKDGRDNDNDGQTDLNDPGCASANDQSEVMHDPQCTGPTDNTESDAACSDGADNDGDGLTDFPQDPGCVSAADTDEFNASQCNDGIDNDGDGAIDTQDFSCSSPTDNDETNPKAACQDGIDNDGDALADFPQDPGCASKQDNDESNPGGNPINVTCPSGQAPQFVGYKLSDPYPVQSIARGATYDNKSVTVPVNPGDRFFLVSYPVGGAPTYHYTDDEVLLSTGFAGVTILANYSRGAQCVAEVKSEPLEITGLFQGPLNAGYQPLTLVGSFRDTCGSFASHTAYYVHVARCSTQCGDGIDNDGDGSTDTQDFSCSSPTDNDETNPKAACQDGVDNDADGKTDFPQDPGCVSKQDNDEFNLVTQCNDGIDNDGDGYIDLTDAACTDATDNDEGRDATCVSIGAPNTVVAGQQFDAVATFTNNTQKTWNATAANAPNGFKLGTPETQWTPGRFVLPGNVLGNQSVTVNFRPTAPTTPGTYPFTWFILEEGKGRLLEQCTRTITVTAPLAQCQDGIDNDNDGAADFPADFSCTSPTDNDETNQKAACQDGFDNDGDGLADFPQDPGCVSKQDNDEFNQLPQCSDGIDNDNDGAADFPNDFSCSSPTDTDETNPKAACQDGFDNDGDGLADFPQDPGCASKQDNDEFNAPLGACRDGLDNDGDGRIDLQDPGCSNPDDTNEGDEAACQDRRDNDGDGLVDFPFDPGCQSPTDTDETNQVQTVDLSIVKTGPSSIVRGQTISYTIQVGNGGTTLATNVTITDQVPSGLTFNDVQSYGPCSVANNVVTCPLGTLSAGQFGSFLIVFDTQATPNCSPVNVVNSATISGTEQDSNQSNNTSSTVNAPTRIDCPAQSQCQDGQDNDFDGRIDFPADPGCSSPTDTNESDDPACADRRDNDFDGLIDFPADPGCASLTDTDESNAAVPQCGDGIDNDNDGAADFPNDFSCSSPTDTDETNPKAACQDGFDNDGDGLADFPQDPGCASKQDNDEFNAPLGACRDGLDNDGDGRIDLQDPGCSNPDDTNEGDEAACQDRRDNDGDGLVDWPLDPGCQNPADNDEYNAPLTQCSDGIDNDGDWRVDMQDPGCSSPQDNNESDDPACSDRLDNDGDGRTDFPLDPGCVSPTDTDETDPFVAQCSDGRDNDFDGKIDMQDPGCSNPQDNNESDDPTQYGCIEIMKETFDPHGTPLPIAAQFTFVLDATRVAYNDATGRARFEQVLAGQHGVAEIIPSGWTQLSVSPAGGTVNVTPGTNCAQITFRNRQVFVANAQCSDGYDNDGDGMTDYPQDTGCSSATDNDEYNATFVPQCRDGIDNDADGLVDWPADPGCQNGDDNNEQNQTATYACSDNVDNDNDGLKDYPADPGCSSATDMDEFNGTTTYACNDNVDNDGDGLKDYPADPGCSSATDTDEFNFRAARCQDGIDNDADGLIDYPLDTGCTTPYDDNEYNDRLWVDRWREFWNWNW